MYPAEKEDGADDIVSRGGFCKTLRCTEKAEKRKRLGARVHTQYFIILNSTKTLFSISTVSGSAKNDQMLMKVEQY